MDERQFLAEYFESQRSPLRSLALRMLGSYEEAEDAVQEVWLRLERVDPASLRNLPGWLRTVMSRICLDMLRARHARLEQAHGRRLPPPAARAGAHGDPEREALEVESLGSALLVVLNTLSPAEHVAFVLHDMFDVPFEEIGSITGRSAQTAKKLASRARLKVRGAPEHGTAELGRHREAISAFLAAVRTGDTDAIAAQLAPDVVRRADPAGLVAPRPAEAHGAGVVAREISTFGGPARQAEVALIDGSVGLLVARDGRLDLVIRITVEDDRVKEYELVAEPARLARMQVRLLAES